MTTMAETVSETVPHGDQRVESGSMPTGEPGPMATRTAAVAVIGAGQAGLASAYELRRAGIDCMVFDAGDRVGDVWRARWDSLQLFTPAAYDGLPGLAFPARPSHFPGKDRRWP
jgi:putative flavoprotein involved in K+ transport